MELNLPCSITINDLDCKIRPDYLNIFRHKFVGQSISAMIIFLKEPKKYVLGSLLIT